MGVHYSTNVGRYRYLCFCQSKVCSPCSSVRWFVCIFVCLFVCPFVYLCVCVYVCLCVCLTLCLCVCIFVPLSVCVCVFKYLFVGCIFVCLCLFLSLYLCLFVCLFCIFASVIKVRSPFHLGYRETDILCTNWETNVKQNR